MRTEPSASRGISIFVVYMVLGAVGVLLFAGLAAIAWADAQYVGPGGNQYSDAIGTILIAVPLAFIGGAVFGIAAWKLAKTRRASA